MKTYTAKIWGDTYRMQADFSQASCQITTEADPDEWVPSGRQVADFGHSPEMAMRDYLERIASDGGDDPEAEDISSDINRAVDHMEC